MRELVSEGGREGVREEDSVCVYLNGKVSESTNVSLTLIDHVFQLLWRVL